jgi:hypothetical protein
MSLLKGFTPGGYCLGDADSIKPSAEALRQTGLMMLRLKADIERRISALVPGEWDGAGAQTFRQLVGQEMDYVLQLEHAAEDLQNADNVLVSGLSEAERIYRKAQSDADNAGIDINDRLIAWPRTVSNESLAAAVSIQRELDQAVEVADAARSLAADVFQKNREFVCDLPGALLDLITLLTMLRGGGTKGTPKPKINTAPTAPTAPKSPAPGQGGNVNWPNRANYKPAQYGTAFHNAMKELERPFEGQQLKYGWRVAKVERTVGGTKRVDTMYINDTTKRIFVGDYVTGPTESVAHATKSWQYMNEPEILALRRQGYEYQQAPAMAHPSHLQ